MNNKLLPSLLLICLFIYSIIKTNFLTIGLLIIIVIFYLIKKQFIFIFINILLFIIIAFSYVQNNKKYDCDFDNFFIVKEIHDNYSIVEQDHHKYLLYQDNIDINEGNIIKINGKLKDINKNGIPYLFSFDEYLSYHNVYYQIEYTNIIVINDKEMVQNKIINKLISKLDMSKEYINLLLFNDKSTSLDGFYDSLIKISAVQLFVISGFHISFLSKIIDEVLYKFTKKKDNILSIIIIFLYVYILKFSLSSLRAFLSLIINKINKYLKLNMNMVDINSLIAILFLLVQPKNLFLVGVQLSFIIVIILGIISNVKSKSSKYLGVIIPFLISLPIIMNMNGNIGILNIFMNFLLTPVVCIIYILGIITIIIPYFDIFLLFIFIGFESMVELIDKLNIYIKFPYLSLYGIIIFYIIIYSILLYIYNNDKKNIIINCSFLSIFLICWYIKPISLPYVLFFDVGQGDSCLIHGINNEYNILIDTGGNIYTDIAKKRLIPYFEKEGIRKLDLVIISHLDYDHYGALDSLVNNFKVEKIISDNNYKNIYFKKLNIENLNNYYSEVDDENTKSSVLLFDYLELKFLMMGDAPIEIEKKIINDYDLDIDVIKVGHHGSKTSTSFNFINEIKPEIAIISVGKNNNYGHPNKEVINCLTYHNVSIFRTDLNGSIKISKNTLNEIIIQTKF